MNTINPTPAEIDSAVNLLSVLELAKDATKLKEALKKIKDEHDAVSAARAAAVQEASEAKQATADLAAKQSRLDSDRAKLKEGMAILFKNNEELELARAAMRGERESFDNWMAAQREALAADRAKVESVAFENKRRAEEAALAMKDADTRMQHAQQLAAEAAAKLRDYESKLAQLKAMVG